MHRSLLVPALALLLAAPVFAQPVGDEFQVHTYNYRIERDPDIAALPSGDFVVVWNRPDGDGVYGIPVDTAGPRVGEEIRVSDFSQGVVDAAVSAAGSEMIVVWEATNASFPDNGSSSIRGRRIDSESELGSEFQVNSYYNGSQSKPAVAGFSDGSFVAVWEAGYFSGLRARRFDDQDVGGSESQLPTETSESQFNPRMDVNRAGDLVIVYETYTSTDTSRTVRARRLSSTGTPLASEIVVSGAARGTTEERNPDVAVAPDGGFVVAWEDAADENAGVRVFSSAGTPMNGPMTISSSQGTPVRPRVAVDTDESFYVVWEEQVPPRGGDSNVRGRRYDSNGSQIGSDFVVAQLTSGLQYEPAITGADGRFLVTWISEQAAGGNDDPPGVEGRLLASDTLLFEDGFESGDTVAWPPKEK